MVKSNKGLHIVIIVITQPSACMSPATYYHNNNKNCDHDAGQEILESDQQYSTSDC